jgi:hypothetical protein
MEGARNAALPPEVRVGGCSAAPVARCLPPTCDVWLTKEPADSKNYPQNHPKHAPYAELQGRG